MAQPCRLCLSETDKFQDLSETREGLPLSVIAMIILPIKIEINDNLPKQFCDDCVEVLLSAYKLRDVSNSSDLYLRGYVNDIREIEILEDLKVEKAFIEEATEIQNSSLEIVVDDEDVTKNSDIFLYDSAVEEDVATELVIQDFDPNFQFAVYCQNAQVKKSAVWSYFGFLTKNEEVIETERDYYYCKLCVEENQCLKPKYKVDSIATSVLFSHLQKVHDLEKSEMFENTPVLTSYQTPEMTACSVCAKSIHLSSMNIHTAIEHQNGSMSRNSENNSQYKVNCFKTSNKSLAWEYFGVLTDENEAQLDKYYFYCRLCVEEDGKLSPKYTQNTSTSILLQHLKNAHVPKTAEELAKRKLPEPINYSKRLKSDEFSCKQCGHFLDSKKALNRHMAQEHDEEQSRDFVCDFENCKKAFTLRDTLLKHVKQSHSGERVKFSCNQCPAILSTRMSLRRHIDACHLKIKSFACDQCDANYSEQKSLKNHVKKVHLGIEDKKVTCELCEMKLPNEWSLRRHYLTHTKEKPHQCQLCHISYASKGDLAKHLTRTHGDFVYKCDQCTSGFRLKSELRDHYKVHFLENEEESLETQEDFEFEYQME